MPRKLRRPKIRFARPALSELQRRVLFTGELRRPVPDDPDVQPGELGRTFEWMGSRDAMKTTWAAVRDELLWAWTAAHRDGKPWAWHEFDAPEARDDEHET